ncbi:FAD/NAD(P)-binding protein [Archangium violaceum]|uniref:FAD/NAD(P)-binding protein n=1 Tax=Archangium violaceum TaxID=83451 RepID=UPI00193C5005|nr:FAD/NAD(P)-binding protein [Archangium violaceum]QRK04289.1 FAD/NAD(P)-binding protein [Archangium violaceum]
MFSGCGEYFFPNAEASRGKLIGSIILPPQHPETLTLTSFGSQCLAALGHGDGAVHMEVLKTHSGELLLLEAGARPPGVDACSAYENATGVNLLSLALKLELGLDFSVPKPAQRSAFWGHIPVRQGEVSEVARPVTRGRLNLALSVKQGDVLESSSSYPKSMGKFIAHGRDFESLQRDFRHLKHFPFVTMKEDRLTRKQIGVIGAGLMGTSIVVQLLDRILERRLDNVDITLFERARRFGPGLAYSTTSDSSLTNTPAGMMSIYPQDDSHFIAWTRANQARLAGEFGALFPVTENAFVPRRLFGLYLEEQLASARERAERAGVVLRFIPSEVVDIHVNNPEECVLETAEGERYHATDVVFAIGNQPTQNFTHLERYENYFSSPYPEHLLQERIDRNARVLVLGSRLSAIDAVLTLASSGHRNRITVASREGLFPAVRSHMDKNHTSLNPEALLNRIQNQGQHPIQAYLQALHLALEEIYGRPLPDDFLEPSAKDGRSELQRAFEQNGDNLAHWQKLVMSMLECMETIWPFLSIEEKESFPANEYKKLLRYIAAIPAVNARKLLELFTCRRLEIHARFQSVEYDERSGRFIATYANRSPESFEVVINATGTGRSLLKSSWPLVPTISKRDVFEFNTSEHFSVHRETLRVRTKSPMSTRFYAPATCCRGEFAITNFIGICLMHSKLVVDDLLGQPGRST